MQYEMHPPGGKVRFAPPLWRSLESLGGGCDLREEEEEPMAERESAAFLSSSHLSMKLKT